MKRGYVVIVLALIFLIPNIIAVATIVNIQSYPNHNVELRALVPDSVYSLIDSFYGQTDSKGYLSKAINIEGNDEFDLKVWIKNGNDIVLVERFDGVQSGDTIYIKMLKGDVGLVDSFESESVNDTSTENETANTTEVVEIVNETNITTQNDTEIIPSGLGITGQSTAQDTGFGVGNSLYYIIGGVLILGLILMGSMALRRKSMIKGQKKINVRKLSEVRKENLDKKKDQIDDYKSAIEEAERKIEEAQKEIKKLKNEDRIKEMKKKIEEDQKALEKMEKGED